jgi:hypothetical protein
VMVADLGTLVNCTLENNAARYGGGVYYIADAWGEGNFTVDGCTFEGNTADADGAGLSLYMKPSSTAARRGEVGGALVPGGFTFVTKSAFTSNSATGRGGGIAKAYGTPPLSLGDDVTFEGNTAAADPSTGDVYYQQAPSPAPSPSKKPKGAVMGVVIGVMAAVAIAVAAYVVRSQRKDTSPRRDTSPHQEPLLGSDQA